MKTQSCRNWLVLSGILVLLGGMSLLNAGCASSVPSLPTSTTPTSPKLNPIPSPTPILIPVEQSSPIPSLQPTAEVLDTPVIDTGDPPQTLAPTTFSSLKTPTPTLIPALGPTPTETTNTVKFDLTSVIGLILSNPADYTSQEVTIVGYYRGWNLLDEVDAGPAVTRSDWVITDSSGAIYVEARNDFDRAIGLDPSSAQDTTKVLRLVGVVRVNNKKQPYIEPQKLEVVGN